MGRGTNAMEKRRSDFVVESPESGDINTCKDGETWDGRTEKWRCERAEERKGGGQEL